MSGNDDRFDSTDEEFEDNPGGEPDGRASTLDDVGDHLGRAALGAGLGGSAALVGTGAAGPAGAALGGGLATAVTYLVERHRDTDEEQSRAATVGAGLATVAVAGIGLLGQSLTGHAALGAPLDQLRRFARLTRTAGLRGLNHSVSLGLGLPSISAAVAELRATRSLRGLGKLGLPLDVTNLALRAHEPPSTIRPDVRDRQSSGWSYHPDERASSP